MTRWLVVAGILGTALLGAIMYIARPDVIEHQVGQLTAPIREAIAKHNADKSQQAKDEAFRSWMAKFKVTPDCVSPSSSLKQLECRNKEDDWRIAFERNWAQHSAGN